MSSIIFNKNMQTSTDVQESLKNLANKVDKSSTEALVNISTLQNLDNETKKNLQQGSTLNTELGDNINNGNTLNDNLTNNIENANLTNTNLSNNSNIATSKNTELQKSLDETKKYIANLDGSQNLPQIRSDITDLQKGMKNNQSINYEGENLGCNNTLNGRTEGMIIRGQTLQNLDCTNKGSMNIGTYNTFLTNNVSMYKPNTLYTVIVIIEDNKLMSGEVYFNGYDSNTSTVFKSATNLSITPISRGILSNVYRTKSDLSDCIRTGFFTHSPETAKGSLVYSVIILEGDWTNKEIPPYFDGIKSVGDLNNNRVGILSTGKNLIDIKKIVPNTAKVNIIDNSIIVSGYEKNWANAYIQLNLYPNKKLTISCSKKIITGSYEGNIELRDSKSNKIVDNIVPHDGIVKIFFYSTNDKTINGAVEFTNIQLEYDKVKTDFKSYISDKKEISLPIEDGLKSLPNGVCDRIYEKDNEIILEQNVGKIRFNGSRTWTKYLHQSNGYFCAVIIFSDVKESRNLICDRFRNQSVWQPTSMHEGIEATKTNKQNALFIKIENSKLTSQDINGFKKWLQDNPTTVYYQLENPIYHKITNLIDIDLDTYDGLTHVNSENGIKPILDFKVPSNLASIVQSNSKAINELYELIDKLLIPNITNNTMNIALK